LIKNFLLTVFSIFLTLALLELVVGNIWLKNHHNRPDKFSKEFYKKYYKKLHHLRDFKDWYYKNGMMYTIIEEKPDNNNLKSTVLINGDSWSEFLLADAGVENTILIKELIKIKKKENINIIISGTTSYSFSPTTVQLKILRDDFNINPNKIITMIDHTDVGDEICRYKDKLEFDEDGTLLRVRPENLYSGEIYNVQSYLAKVDIYDSKDLNIIKYIKNKILRKQLKEKKIFSSIRCIFSEIMRPVEFGLNKNEYIHLKEATLRYIDAVFSDKNVEKLLLVIHPHMKHFTGEYNFYFGDFLKEILQENNFKNKITLLDFKEIFYEVYFNGDKSKNYQDIYWVNDPSSHINVPARIPFIKKVFNELLH